MSTAALEPIGLQKHTGTQRGLRIDMATQEMTLQQLAIMALIISLIMTSLAI